MAYYAGFGGFATTVVPTAAPIRTFGGYSTTIAAPAYSTMVAPRGYGTYATAVAPVATAVAPTAFGGVPAYSYGSYRGYGYGGYGLRGSHPRWAEAWARSRSGYNPGLRWDATAGAFRH